MTHPQVAGADASPSSEKNARSVSGPHTQQQVGFRQCSAATLSRGIEQQLVTTVGLPSGVRHLGIAAEAKRLPL